MASSEDRLPRVAHAERPRPDEKILWKTGADLNNGWLGRHGTLYLTEQRLVFVPTPPRYLALPRWRILLPKVVFLPVKWHTRGIEILNSLSKTSRAV